MKSLIVITMLFISSNIYAQSPRKETTFLKDLNEQQLNEVRQLTQGMERYRIPVSSEMGSCPTFIDNNTNEVFVLYTNSTKTEFYLKSLNVEAPEGDRFKGKEKKD